MKYLTEFIANGELQTYRRLEPENIKKVKQYIEQLAREEQTTFDITADGKKYIMVWNRNADRHTISITEASDNPDETEMLEVYDFKQII